VSRSKYEQVHDGEWWLFQEPDSRSNRYCKVACCDCGLTHGFYIKIRKGKIYMRADRLPKETGGRRRALKAEKETDHA
jgi:hypothetical protein